MRTIPVAVLAFLVPGVLAACSGSTAVEAEPGVTDWLLGQPQSSLSTDPSLVGDWGSRLLARDPKVRATAEAALAEGGRSSFPLLRRFLAPDHEDLHSATFRILQRIGPPAIPLLEDLLRHESDSVRRSAVNELVDLAPRTESIQPALRRVLRDEDGMVAGDAARALGALGEQVRYAISDVTLLLPLKDRLEEMLGRQARAALARECFAVIPTMARLDVAGFEGLFEH